MSKTAIVPVEATQGMLTKCYGLARAWPAVVNARPPVPDELIEEAAKAMFYVNLNNNPEYWTRYADDKEREHFRNMARAALRVFNGGKDE